MWVLPAPQPVGETDRLDHRQTSGRSRTGEVLRPGVPETTPGIVGGVGNKKGGPIPIKRNGIILNYKKDRNGETVITKLNEDTLKEIAEEANGVYINGSSTNEVVETIKDLLDKMDKKEFESKQIADFKDQFQWFLGFGILFLFIDIFLLERKTEWLKKLNLFNENF